MKIRLISILLAITLFTTGIVWCQAQTTLGDVNGDGKINAADALLILKYSVGKIKLKEEAKQAADTTGSHDLSAKDALCILQKAVGSIRHFPAEITEVKYKSKSLNWYGLPQTENGFIKSAFLLRSYEEYETFIQKYGIYSDDPDIIDPKPSYTANFFKEHQLLVYSALSGNRNKSIEQIYIAQDELNIKFKIQKVNFEGLMDVDYLFGETIGVELDKSFDVEKIHFSVIYQSVLKKMNETIEIQSSKKFEYDFNG